MGQCIRKFLVSLLGVFFLCLSAQAQEKDSVQLLLKEVLRAPGVYQQIHELPPEPESDSLSVPAGGSVTLLCQANIDPQLAGAVTRWVNWFGVNKQRKVSINNKQLIGLFVNCLCLCSDIFVLGNNS